MLGIEIAEQLIDLESLDKEISDRHKLLDQMVGNMWPYVIRDELYRLNNQKRKIEKIVERNYEYYGKRRNN